LVNKVHFKGNKIRLLYQVLKRLALLFTYQKRFTFAATDVAESENP